MRVPDASSGRLPFDRPDDPLDEGRDTEHAP
ncbi:hypothetical protein HD594_002818 [Microbacterium thalassium]|uniref:Uncharacterized protein n=1 Tax=Microbacterium thalassium TaxID=362649 RepID=A0A7X0KVR1_9MICO|nr:hypothetical protein [Microbacterium thalassium]